jgi:hypothetical protein
MSNSYTPNLKLAEPALGDRNWNVALNGDLSTIDSLAPAGGLAVTTHEVPSATTKVDVAAGTFIKQDGTVATFSGATSVSITSSTTQVVYLDGTASWAVTTGSSYPTTAHVRLATVAAGASTISSITDNRQCFPVCGPTLDGVSLVLGTATGLQIGTSSSQKLGFFGTAPITRPTMGAATAGGTYTATEQSMLQAVYSAVRSLGLGS